MIGLTSEGSEEESIMMMKSNTKGLRDQNDPFQFGFIDIGLKLNSRIKKGVAPHAIIEKPKSRNRRYVTASPQRSADCHRIIMKDVITELSAIVILDTPPEAMSCNRLGRVDDLGIRC